jgi:ribose/xylose/arabinose/galactoside ABC-type transport system permease subunit
MSDKASAATSEVGTRLRSGPFRARADREAPLIVLLREFAIVIVLLVTVAVFAVWYGPKFLALSNLSDIADSAALTALFATGEAIVVMAGAIDLSIAAIAAVSGIVAAKLLGAGVPSIFALILTILFGCVLGAVNGLLVSRLRLTALVATLATLSAYSGLAFIIAGGEEIFEVNGFAWLGQHKFWDTLTAPTVVMVIVVLLTAAFVRHTVWGMRLLAVGGGDEAARRCGIKVKAYTVGAFSFSGAVSALAGCITLGFLTAAEPAAANTAIFDAITAVALGGVALSGGEGSILRVLVGALVIGVITTGLLLNGVQPYYALVVTGVLLIVAVAFESFLTRAAEARANAESG